MAHAVDEAAVVKGLLIEDFPQVMAGLLRVGPVGQVALDVLDHLDDLDVGAAVTGPLQGGQGGGMVE